MVKTTIFNCFSQMHPGDQFFLVISTNQFLQCRLPYRSQFPSTFLRFLALSRVQISTSTLFSRIVLFAAFCARFVLGWAWSFFVREITSAIKTCFVVFPGRCLSIERIYSQNTKSVPLPLV